MINRQGVRKDILALIIFWAVDMLTTTQLRSDLEEAFDGEASYLLLTLWGIPILLA